MEQTPADYVEHTMADTTHAALAPEYSNADIIVFGVQELLEEILKHLPPGALLRHRTVCKDWQYTINKFAQFKRSLFLLPVETTEVWEVDRRAAHKHSHGGQEQVVLGKITSGSSTSTGKPPIPCNICSSRGAQRPAGHSEPVLLPIQFNPLSCDQRPEDKAANLDERASRPACAEVYLRKWGLRDETLQPWHDMLLTQPPCRRVRVHVSGDYEAFSGSHAAVLDAFDVSDPEGVRLGLIVSFMKERLQHCFETGEIYLDDVTVFVPNAIEVMEGDGKEVERRTKAREGKV